MINIINIIIINVINTNNVNIINDTNNTNDNICRRIKAWAFLHLRKKDGMLPGHVQTFSADEEMPMP
jgi:hypothetical protein